MALLNSLHPKTVIAIGELDKQKRFVCNATGFLVGFLAKKSKDPKKRTYHIFILTNRHVFEGKNDVYLRFNKRNGKSEIVLQPLFFSNKTSRWLADKNNKVDLALLKVNPQILTEHNIDFAFFNEETFAYQKKFGEVGIAVGDEVYILGFPMGFAGDIQNSSYVKAGIISRFDRELLQIYKAFFVDSSIFPGNSGGPVILKPTNIALPNTKPVTSFYLLGAVSGFLSYGEELWSHQTNPPSVVSLEREHSGLSFVVPMDYAKKIFNRWIKIKKQFEKTQKQKTNQTDIQEIKTTK